MAQTVPFRRFLKLARPELRTLSVATVALFIASGLGLIYPQAIRVIIDGVVDKHMGGQRVINRAALLLLVVFALQGVFAALRAYLFTVAGERVVTRLRHDLYAAIVRQ